MEDRKRNSAPIIEIKCSHCGKLFKTERPSLGDIAIFECPKCHNLWLLVGGFCLPVDKKIFLQGNEQAKKDHILDVVTDFISGLVNCIIFNDIGIGKQESFQQGHQKKRMKKKPKNKIIPSVRYPDKPPITDDDVKDFTRIYLRLLDKPGYCLNVFGKGGEKK